jgi:hypothetical protein
MNSRRCKSPQGCTPALRISSSPTELKVSTYLEHQSSIQYFREEWDFRDHYEGLLPAKFQDD